MFVSVFVSMFVSVCAHARVRVLCRHTVAVLAARARRFRDSGIDIDVCMDMCADMRTCFRIDMRVDACIEMRASGRRCR